MKASDIQKYRKFVEGGSSQTQLQRLSDRYSQQVQESISHYDVIINSIRANTILRDGIEYKCIVDYGSIPSKANVSNTKLSFTHEIVTKQLDQFHPGDVLEFAHNPYSEKKKYMITKTIETRDGYDLSVMQRCTSTIKWINSMGQTIEEYFILLSNSSTILGLDNGQIITMPQERRSIAIQNNQNTKKIEKQQRFIFDERVWSVVGIDRLVDGLITLTLEEHQINPSTDNMELRIADCREDKFEIRLLNEFSQISLKTPVTFEVELYKNGIRVLDSIPRFLSSNEQVLTVDSEGRITALSEGQSTIIVEWSGVTLSKDILVRNVQMSNYSVQIIGSDTVRLNQTVTYEAQFQNNGIPYDESSTFELFAEDGSSKTKLAKLIKQSNGQCEIQFLQNYGVVVLKVVSKNGLISGEKRIEIKGIL